jgi:hypothetical protein
MRLDYQNRSTHNFHAYSALNRVDISAASTTQPSEDSSKSIPVSSFLPSTSDCGTLKENYAILMARVVVEEIPFFQQISGCVPMHIIHAL